MAYTISKERLAELLEKARAARATTSVQETKQAEHTHSTDRFGNVIEYNEKQSEAVTRASGGESIVLIGAAGTGKTTCMKGVLSSLIQSGRAGLMEGTGHKYLPHSAVPGVVIVAFTRRAVNNIRRNMSEDLKENCITIHKLLEYEPYYYEVTDPATGETKKTMKFEPTRNSFRPLPEGIKCIVVEESSMVSVELFKQMQAALPHKVQWIFLGDIQQLPPVFGSAILGYKMLELPTVELTQVYRQALESPIIRLAHRVLSGVPIDPKDLTGEEWKQAGLVLHPWKKKLSPDVGLLTASKFFTNALHHGQYDPEEDIILLPFNKSFGTLELNKHIANYIAKQAGRDVYEIIAGFNTLYLSVGDKILFDKEDAIVKEIKRNPAYFGKIPAHHSPTLDYWGFDPKKGSSVGDETEEDIDIMLSAAAEVSPEDRVKQCSHLITIEFMDTGHKRVLDKASELNELLLGYTLTVHKSQGSEWRKVFLVFHQSHATMLQRELLYTAITRAREELYVICEPETFTNGVRSQKIKGNTLAEKAEFFKGKLETNGGDY